MTMQGRPDRPLLVKCAFDRWNKRISFASAKNCSYELLRKRVEQCFSLYATQYVISYRDDDGEVTDITTESDLTEAIQYFQAGPDDPPLSSAASILSGRSFGSKRITLRVHVTVDYDGPSLSDTSSLASLEEYRGRNESSSELSWPGASGAGENGELDDDSVTVSSRDNSGRFRNGTLLIATDARRVPSRPTARDPSPTHQEGEKNAHSTSERSSHDDDGPFADRYLTPDTNHCPEDAQDMAEILRIRTEVESLSDGVSSCLLPSFSDALTLSAQDRGAAWLRDQNARAMRAMLGAIPAPSDASSGSISLTSSDERCLEESLGGGLALERDPRGKYYYSYTGGSSSLHDSGFEEGFSCKDELSTGSTSSHQKLQDDPNEGVSVSGSQPYLTTDIPPEVLPFVAPPSPPPGSLTTCSACGVLLEAIRYPVQLRSELDALPSTFVVNNNNEELSMKHPGVKCAHCLQDIVGARFHCAICDSIDICSNCESAGLPGNLDSSDGGHSSSHIMIKIPYPLESSEVQTASQRAFHLWTGRDAAQVLTASRSKPSSVYSSYAHTVVGSRMQLSLQDDAPEDHRVNYDIWDKISCASCEERSYLLHDPMHSFFKLPRPVQRPLESSSGFLPKLYKVPAGPLGGVTTSADPKDLCEDCEAVDTHDETHVFVVFKAPVDMPRFRQFANLDNPNESPPIIPFPVYF
ncbi:hypothetical protein ID866_3824 [Astraeus odoratus]|nr:hypothetical protein ID866_3824 [Astraeus odoratus]